MQVFKKILLATFFIVAGSLVVNISQVKAESQNKAQDTYSYKASEGDNLSYIVRDSINQYAKDNDKKINAAQRMYAETNIVNDMGAYWLDINQDVQVSKAKVQEYVNNAESLDADTEAAWQYYADTTDVQAMIDGSSSAVQENKITAEQNAEEAKKVEEAVSGSTDTQKTEEDTSKKDDSGNQNNSEESTTSNESNQSGFGNWFKNNWAKLVLVGLIAMLIYRVINKKNTEV